MDSLIPMKNRPPMTQEGQVGVIMLVTSGKSASAHWFDYRPSFRQPIVRIEWERDDGIALLPEHVGLFLIRNRYARQMTDDEVASYNATAEETQHVDTDEPATSDVTTDDGTALDTPPVKQTRQRRERRLP